MKPYITKAGASLAELEVMVNEQILEGYVPEGSVTLLALRYVQVMVNPKLITVFASAVEEKYSPKQRLNPVPDDTPDQSAK